MSMANLINVCAKCGQTGRNADKISHHTGEVNYVRMVLHCALHCVSGIVYIMCDDAGTNGADGDKGQLGARGPVGPRGERGLPGPRGRGGEDGRHGEVRTLSAISTNYLQYLQLSI